jgi:hypothetical protein
MLEPGNSDSAQSIFLGGYAIIESCEAALMIVGAATATPVVSNKPLQNVRRVMDEESIGIPPPRLLRNVRADAIC